MAEHWLVWPTLTVADAQETATDVTVGFAGGGGGGVLPPLPPLPQPASKKESERATTRGTEAVNLRISIVQDLPIWGIASAVHHEMLETVA